MKRIQQVSQKMKRLRQKGLDPASLQFRLTLGITALSLLGLGSIGMWTIWDMRQMLLVKHQQAIEQAADRFPQDLTPPLTTAKLQQHIDRRSSPDFWIWLKQGNQVVAKCSSLKQVPLQADLVAIAHTPVTPEVHNIDGQYLVLYSRTLPFKGSPTTQVYFAQEITHDYTVLTTLINSLRGAILVATAILALLFALLIWRSLRPLRRMNRLAAAGNDLEQAPSEVKDLVQAFSQLSARLNATGVQQQQFTDSMSHELRTSLSMIYGYLQSTLRRGDNLTDPQKNALEVAVGETERTIQLLGTLLDLAKANQGSMSFHRIPLDLPSWLQNARWDLPRPLALEIDSSPLIVQTDPEKLHQIIQHLLTNAAQYSKPDTPIALTLQTQNQEAVIQVRDRGCGIPAVALPHIFDPFYRVEASRCRSTGGIGLGLAIVKTLTERMGGRVAVQSVEKEGSTFEIRFPIAKENPREDSL
jgi:signal transduction histidine kinase